jgi:hypothetical protein
MTESDPQPNFSQLALVRFAPTAAAHAGAQLNSTIVFEQSPTSDHLARMFL